MMGVFKNLWSILQAGFAAKQHEDRFVRILADELGR